LLPVIVTVAVATPSPLSGQDRTAVSAAQKALQQLGYDVGPADGAWGRRSEAATRLFQKDLGIAETGIVDDALSRTLAQLVRNLVPETAFLSKTSSDYQLRGQMDVTAAAGCRQPSYSVNVSVTSPPSGFAAEQFPLFHPGVRYKFANVVCIAADNTAHRLTRNLALRGSMSIEEGRVISSGRMTASGSVAVTMDDGVPVFEITSDATDPLILYLSRGGFIYASGKGTLVTPAGTRYAFPIVDE
jgi:hypothetical protein